MPAGGRRAGAGRPRKPWGDARSVIRLIRLRPAEAAAQDAAAASEERSWADWMRQSAAGAIERQVADKKWRLGGG